MPATGAFDVETTLAYLRVIVRYGHDRVIERASGVRVVDGYSRPAVASGSLSTVCYRYDNASGYGPNGSQAWRTMRWGASRRLSWSKKEH